MKEIEDWPGYFVDSLGNVWTGVTAPLFKMTPRLNNRGYLRVRLCKGKIQKEILVHRLVARAFLPATEEGLEINHKNLVKTDNSIDNLEWCTHSENMRHYTMSKT